MHCLDCRMQGTVNTAVALCVTCGAAICQDHVELAAGSRRGLRFPPECKHRGSCCGGPDPGSWTPERLGS
ncbi:DUF2180 family protein [Streptomyces sp. NPDC014734]|uniref:DUF2180 family protein n=1 Tax=Streptomyces sp. NPDC014734 TaxID=3364886 RepID=UPI0036FA03C4